MRRNALLAAVIAVTTLGFTHSVEAQPKASQHGTVSQTVNHTTITLEFDRPVLRGRSVFGDILDYDVLWTPGANRTTWIEFSEPVHLEGVPLSAGRYGIWTIPHESEPWEIVLVREWDTNHSYYPEETQALRVRVSPEEGAHMETMAFYFPEVGAYETTLRFHWGEVVLPLQITVGH